MEGIVGYAGWYQKYRIDPELDRQAWDLAVWLMDKELGAKGLECRCEGCGRV